MSIPKYLSDAFKAGEANAQFDRLQRLIDDVKAELRRQQIQLNEFERAIKILWDERQFATPKLGEFRDE